MKIINVHKGLGPGALAAILISIIVAIIITIIIENQTGFISNAARQLTAQSTIIFCLKNDDCPEGQVCSGIVCKNA